MDLGPRTKPSEDKEVFTLPDWVPVETWNEYLEMRKKIRKPMTEKAKGLAVNTLEELKVCGFDPRLVLEQSIMNSWQGLFELKVNVSTKRVDQNRPRDAFMSQGAGPEWTIEQCRSYRAKKAAEGKPISPDIERYMRGIEGKQ